MTETYIGLHIFVAGALVITVAVFIDVVVAEWWRDK